MWPRQLEDDDDDEDEAEYFVFCNASKETSFTRAVLLFLLPELSGMQKDIFGDSKG